MPRLPDADFDKVHTELAKHPLGAVMIRDYAPITDAQGHPTIDNAFILSIEQRDVRGGKLAHTRIDIRGEDGKIVTSFERDHVAFEPADTGLGKTVYADIEDPDSTTGEILIPKGTVLTAAHIAALRQKRIARAATKLLTPTEIVAELLPLVDKHHRELPDNAMPVLTALRDQARARGGGGGR